MVNFIKPCSATTDKKNFLISNPIFQREGDFNPLKRTFNRPVLLVLNKMK
jgi:hypothetical protein